MDGSVPFRAALPLFGIGVLTLLLSCCFCCYLWRLKAQGQREMGYRYVMFKKKKGKQEICPVCLEEFDDGNKTVITRCSHLFHHKCLNQWLQENNSCPMCKTAVRIDVGENTNLVNGADAV